MTGVNRTGLRYKGSEFSPESPSINLSFALPVLYVVRQSPLRVSTMNDQIDPTVFAQALIAAYVLQLSVI
jgi:hypothetical protein